MSSTFHQTFKEQFRRIAIAMITTPEYYEIFTRFRSAYEYRRQFSWLEEHQPHRKNQSGLAAALQIALATYIVSEQCISAEPDISPASPYKQDGCQINKPSMNAEWANEFKIAVAATIEERFCLERFGQRLARAAVDVEAVAPDVLRKHIVNALNNYCDQYMIGLSPDPF